MMQLWFDHVKSYTEDIRTENENNTKMYATNQPGIYTNVDPDSLLDCQSADIDINR